MKVYILSRNAKLYSTRRLVEAGQARGWEMMVIDYLKCSIEIMKGELQINYMESVWMFLMRLFLVLERVEHFMEPPWYDTLK